MNIRLLPYVGTLLMAFLSPAADAISEDPIHISHEPEFVTVYYYQEVVSANFFDVAQKNTPLF